MSKLSILLGAEEGLGNAILKTAVIAQIKAEHPDWIIDILSSHRAYALLKNNPHVRKVFLPEDKIEGRYDIGFATCFRTGAFDSVLRDCSDKFIFEPNPDYNNESELNINIRLAYTNDLISNTEEFYPTEFVTNVKKRKKARRLLFHFGCINAPQWNNRHWPRHYWVELLTLCKSLEGYDVGIITGPEEISDSEAIAAATGAREHKDTLEGTAELLRASTLLVSLDSGIMHLATTTGIKQIALFGPTSEIKSKPHAAEGLVTIIRKEINCQRCYISNKTLFQRCEDNICMKQISPGFVFDEIKRIIA